MKTAITQALEIIELAREGEIDNDLRSIRHRINELLKTEKQQIIDAVKFGNSKAAIEDKNHLGELYFNAIFQ